MEIDFVAKNQVNICKRSGKKVRKTETDGWTECKPIVPFGFAGRRLKNKSDEPGLFLKNVHWLQVYTFYQPTFEQLIREPVYIFHILLHMLADKYITDI